MDICEGIQDQVSPMFLSAPLFDRFWISTRVSSYPQANSVSVQATSPASQAVFFILWHFQFIGPCIFLEMYLDVDELLSLMRGNIAEKGGHTRRKKDLSQTG